MLKHYVILTFALYSASLVASTAAPADYPSFKAKVVTTLNDIYREKSKNRSDSLTLQVHKHDLKTLIDQNPLWVENIIDDLKQRQKEIAAQSADKSATDTSKREAKKIASHITELQSTLDVVAPALDTSHKAPQPKAAQQMPLRTIVVVPTIAHREQQKTSAPEKSFALNSNEEVLLKTLSPNNDMPKIHQACTAYNSASHDADAEFDIFRRQQADRSFDLLLAGLKSAFKQHRIDLKASAIVTIADYAQEWVKAPTNVPTFQAPLGYDEQTALRIAMAASLDNVKPSDERDHKYAASRANSLSSAASASLPPHRQVAASVQASAREQADIALAIKQSLQDQDACKKREQELKKWLTPLTVVPHESDAIAPDRARCFNTCEKITHAFAFTTAVIAWLHFKLVPAPSSSN